MHKTLNRRGSMLMTVMVILIVAAIIAAKLMPDEQTMVKREDEGFYNSDLSQLREAIDLVRLAAKNPNSDAYNNPSIVGSGWQDFVASDTPASISEKIASLTQWGFLRKSELRDNSIPEFLWGADKNASYTYWMVSTNYASNTSFEIHVDGLDTNVYVAGAWEKESVASASVTDKVQLNSMAIDEYPYQNKLGDSTRGEKAIKMIKITK